MILRLSFARALSSSGKSYVLARGPVAPTIRAGSARVRSAGVRYGRSFRMVSTVVSLAGLPIQANFAISNLIPGALISFFFQAEDGIRDYKVTGVQTCALPI